MIELIEKFTLETFNIYGDSAAKRFYENLAAGKLTAVRPTRKGGLALYPPRGFDPATGTEDVEWYELSGNGTLYAFTQQDRALRFARPDVIGLVELPDLDGGRIIAKIEAPYEACKIGMPLRFVPVKISDRIYAPGFRPID